ncbi:hypothetical protein [Pseudohoeflea coraliihabitans]|uniref:Uncharacterized protein n=1 Tax=Pseudohoeflea coraliihabitans TaxID=2860393 RepID=A0ABS6WKV1_9HYPH|nr:hypothetical protein [Pseudohoeflea sp. DP4N28-3]MBW3096505.1 hypothetical protein [Pseudohoeflea sp. DP4N28-3]
MFSIEVFGLPILIVLVFAAAFYFMGCAMDALAAESGFGPFGNMLILFTGFLTSRMALDALASPPLPWEWLMPAAVGCAFTGLILAMLVKLLGRMA